MTSASFTCTPSEAQSIASVHNLEFCVSNLICFAMSEGTLYLDDDFFFLGGESLSFSSAVQ